MTVRFDPAAGGQAFQGDIVFLPLPAGFSPARVHEVPLRESPGGAMLVLAEGEAMGHHHALRYGLDEVARFRDDGLARDLEAAVGVREPAREAAPPPPALARLWRDDILTAMLAASGVLTTTELCVGYLEVPDFGAPPVTHEEHDPILLAPGTYYVGRKREWRDGTARLHED